MPQNGSATRHESVDYHAIGTSSESENNPFRIVQRQVDQAAEMLKLDPAIHELLRWPLREMHVTLPVRMDDGSVKVFQGFPGAVQRCARSDQRRYSFSR